MYELDSVLRIKDEFVPQCEYDRLISKIDGKDYPLYDVREKEIIFPRGKGISYLKRYGVTYCDHRTHGRAIPQDSNFIPRQGQAEIVDDFCSKLPRWDGGILISGCGTGKTVMSAETIVRIGRSTMICIHKEFLANQWINALKIINPNLKVGICRSDRCDTGWDYDVVIAFVQSLTAREYPTEFYNSFGVMVLDEVHRYGANVWKKIFELFPAKIRFAVTATANRIDGMWGLIEAHIGPILTRFEAEFLRPKIFGIPINTYIDPYHYEKPWLDTNMQRGKLISLLYKDEGRNKILAKWGVDAYKKARKGMIISERIEHLKMLHKLMLPEVPKECMDFYIGGRKQKLLDKAAEKDIIFSSYQMTAEGLDIPDLDLLLLASPMTNILQAVGRTVREFEGKSQPVVLDPIDELIPRLVWSWGAREQQYLSRKYEIKSSYKK